MEALETIVILTIASLIYGNFSLIIAAGLQHAPFIMLLSVAIGWSTAFLLIFITFAEKIIKFLSKISFFEKNINKLKEKAKNYHKGSISGVILATIIPLPPFGIYAGSVIGLTLGFSKIKTFILVWLANMLQFAIMYAALSWFI